MRHSKPFGLKFLLLIIKILFVAEESIVSITRPMTSRHTLIGQSCCPVVSCVICLYRSYLYVGVGLDSAASLACWYTPV